MKMFVTALFLCASVVYAADTKKPAPAASGNKVTLTKDNALVMNDYFSGESVAILAQKAKEMDAKLKSNEALILVINSGGGSIDAGLELIENLNNLNRPVHTLTLFSASMGFQTVQGVKGQRLIIADGTLMSHKARGGFYGEFPGQLDSRYSYYLRKIKRLDQQVVARTAGKHSEKSYANLIENEYWCDGKDCISQGFADKVVRPNCDSSLNGTHDQLWDRFVYMGHVVEIVDVMADCPLITTALSFQVYIDGEPLFETYKPKATNTTTTDSKNYYSSSRDSYTRSILDSVGLETAENIKKLVTKKMDARGTVTKKEIVKY